MTKENTKKILTAFIDKLGDKYVSSTNDSTSDGVLFSISTADPYETDMYANGLINAEGDLTVCITTENSQLIDILEYNNESDEQLATHLQDAMNAYELLRDSLKTKNNITLTEDDFDFGLSDSEDDNESEAKSDEEEGIEDDSSDGDIQLVLGKLDKVKEFMNTAGDKVQGIMNDVADDDVDTKIALISIQSDAYNLASDISDTIEDLTPEEEDPDDMEESVHVGSRTKLRSRGYLEQAYSFLGAATNSIERASALDNKIKSQIKESINRVKYSKVFEKVVK